MANRRYMVVQGSFIADQLVAPGSVLTDADLNGSEPGSALVEVDGNGSPVNPDDLAKLRNAGINFGPVQVAPVLPHAPNPTRPQAIPGQAPGAVAFAEDREYVPGEGVESNESAEARVTRLEQELATARAAAAAVAAADTGDGPVAPTRRTASTASTAGTAGPLDGSVADLEKHLATVNDGAELDRLHTQEAEGKNRSTALAAIDARRDELTA